MSIAEQFTLLLRAMKEDDDPEMAQAAAEFPLFPRLSNLIEEKSFPTFSLPFGIASDGLPVALNLLNPTPGPILVVGDAGSGKTAFLRVAAQSVIWTQRPERVRFFVLTTTPESWSGWQAAPHHLATLSPFSPDIRDVLFDLAAWAQADVRSQARLFLIDDLSALMHLEADLLENLRWLFVHGPNFRLWPIVTLNPQRAFNLPHWRRLFKTQVFGRIEQVNDAFALAPGSPAADLLAGAQFCMRARHGAWLKFWLPTPD